LVSALDRVETVGFPVSDAMSGLRLSETFISPSVLAGRSRLPLDWALADHPRLFLSGPAGSGKTSILKWLAISSARQSLGGLMSFLNDFLPVYVPLRGAAGSEVPVADSNQLARIAFPSFESDQLAGIVRQRCEVGTALLLFDGLDEIDTRSRRSWLGWLSEMTGRYPDNRFVITSRTPPFGVEPLMDQRFATASLEILDNQSKAQLIRQWFAAVAPLEDAWSESSPAESASRLTRIIESNSRLHDLAATPLMCALMCALFRERGDLPLLGADVYGAFIDMLVERRDTERGITGIRELPKPEALMLLEELAQRMVLDGVTEFSRDNAQAIVAKAALSLPRLQMNPGEALEHLLTRSGLIIEPASGRVQFVHLTFMEFLAARSFVENDNLTLLIKQAHDPAWHSVIVLAASQARLWQGEQLVEGMLQRCQEEPRRRVAVAAVLQESIASMVRLSPSLREESEALWRQQADNLTPRVVVKIESGRASELSSLYEWLAGDDEIRKSGPVLVSRSHSEPEENALVIAGDRPPNMVRIIQSVLGWHRAILPRDQCAVLIEGDGVRVVIDSSRTPR
jgi:predicted NACHT family NTPase